jgi:CBF/Mak21 family
MFSKPDCSYYSLLIIRNLLRDSKLTLSNRTVPEEDLADSVKLVKNSLDMLRFITLPEDDEAFKSRKAFLVRGNGSSGDGTNFDDEDSSEDEEEDNDGTGVDRVKMNGRKGSGMKRAIVSVESSSKRCKRLPQSEKLVHLPSYKKVFSKAWLALLAMPLTNAQHKIVLKHLPENVMGNLSQPLLLADYMTQSYEQGGVVAVLALESLFQLIVTHNLDYPKFFASLYRLCTYDVLSAKYRAKFMKLLTMCLRSANMPGYLVAAFAKRLSQLSLRLPSPSALFCVAQVTWLLRQHQQCLVLVHKHNVDTGSDSVERLEFDPVEEHDLEKCNALHSSLWEIESLSGHYLHTVSAFAKGLQSVASTSSGMDAPSLIVEDFLEHSYASLMESEASGGGKGKKNEINAAFAFKEPLQLIPSSSIMSKCFGSI